MPASSSKHPNTRPEDVGILAMELYFPALYVDQVELEAFDGVSSGKYTVGLGQSAMGFCSDREDINSLCLTALQQLMEKYNLSYSNIGRLEVGTETILDKSKSVKTVLMQLFEASGNSSVEGIDTTNACYGGTAALFNAVNWVESSAWDGRYAVVLAGDIAVYASGNARCTGGAGAVAMLIGPNAPLVIDQRVRSTYMQHVYDFYKPDMNSEYPVVDGKLSVQCYLQALDECYQQFKKKAQREGIAEHFTLTSADGFVFHSPYCKLVQKSLARLMLNDFLQDPNPDFQGLYKGLEGFREVKLKDSYFDKQVESAFMKSSEQFFIQKTKPSLFIASQVGNMYTPSLYSCLVSFIINHSFNELPGKRIVLFSYGSGLASSMFTLVISEDTSQQTQLEKIHQCLKEVRERLNSRVKMTPEQFEQTLKLREETHHKAPYTPVGSTENFFPGTWYLTEVDSKHRRQYEIMSSSAAMSNSSALDERTHVAHPMTVEQPTTA